MKPEFHNILQNTDAWFELRKGLFTASTFKDLFLGKTTKGYEKAIYKPVYERLTDESPESFSSEYMERGHELEPLAKDTYEMGTFNIIDNGGFFTLGEWIGASPDGLIGSDGLIEIKCPAYNTMINYMLIKELPAIYKWQVHGQLYVTGRAWCDFMAFHPKLKPIIIRIDRDETIIKELEIKLNESIKVAEDILFKLKAI
jgi:putative phage-type endonuclease